MEKVKRTRNVHRALLACLAVAWLVPAAAYAQAPREPAAPGELPLREQAWSVTPALGLGAAGDLDDATVALGVAAGYNWTPRLAVEGEMFVLPSATQGLLAEVDTQVWTFSGNVLYYFAEEPNIPYVAAGFGIGHGNADIDDPELAQLDLDTSSTEPIFNFGGGISRRLNDRASIRGDLRYFLGDDFVADFFRLNAGVTLDLGRR